jgi:regulator of protease activity HflC (stomatin/prohibitin superfamily)
VSDVPAAPPPHKDDTAASALEDAVGLAFGVLKVVMVLLVVAFVGSGMFTVAPHERAFVVRLGQLDETPREPGAHLAWPVIDEVIRVDVGRATRHVTDAFDLARGPRDLAAEAQGGRITRRGGVDPAREGYLVTGDANLVHATLAARVLVTGPLRSLVTFEDGAAAVQALLESAAVRTAAGREVDELLGAGKGAFTEALRRTLQDALDGLDAGLTVQGIELERDLVPPPQARDAFEQVSAAAQDRDRLRSEALAAASRIQGEAIAAEARIRSEARTRAGRLRADAEADAAVFLAQLTERRRDPVGYENRRVATLLAEALTKVEETFLVGPGPLRLRLERDVRARRREAEERARREEAPR